MNVPGDIKGFSERPNFLSSVIQSFPTNVHTQTHMYENREGSPTYDLDVISNNI